MKTHLPLALAVMFLFVFSVPLFSWNGAGHMTVACVAYQHLKPATRNRVNALLKLNPDYQSWLAEIPKGTSSTKRKMMVFMIASTWADQIKSEQGYTDDGTDQGNRPDGATSSQNIGYSDHLHHKYWHFVDTYFSEDGTPLPATPSPNAETQINAFRAVLSSNQPDDLKSYDLVWLLHLEGDVHQPLHAASRVSQVDPEGDNGGNNVRVCTPTCGSKLHTYWDDLLGTSKSPSAAIQVGQTLPSADATLGSDLNTATWIKESFDYAKSNVYVSPIAAGDGPFTLTASYKQSARKLAKERVALAGLRLANILNSELK